MRKYATRRLVAKNVPVTLAQYFPQGKFRLRGRGNRTYSAMHAAIRPEKYRKYLRYEPKTLDKMEPARRYNMLLTKFRQDLPLEYSDHMTVYLR
jgi:hypothetical protein